MRVRERGGGKVLKGGERQKVLWGEEGGGKTGIENQPSLGGAGVRQDLRKKGKIWEFSVLLIKKKRVVGRPCKLFKKAEPCLLKRGKIKEDQSGLTRRKKRNEGGNWPLTHKG